MDMLATPDGLPLRRRRWAAIAIWLAMAMAVLDGSIANVALPTIAREFGATPAASIWVVNAYQIATVMLLLPLASLGEIVGYRRVYMVGLTLFALASFGCAAAPGLATLALARFVQGFGAAAVMAVNGALVRHTYPRALLGRGIGANALVVAMSAAAGPSIAAAVLAVGSWRWLFAVNLPLALLSVAIGARALPHAGGIARRFDVVSALLSATVLAALFFAASVFVHGGGSLLTLAPIALVIALGMPLVRRMRGQAQPLIPLDLLAVPMLRLSYLSSILAFAGQMTLLVSLPFVLQHRFGLGAVAAGLLITPMPLGVALSAPIAGRLIERVPASLLGGIGLAIVAAGAALLAALPSHTGAAGLALAIALCGIGFGMFSTPNNRTMLGLAPPDRSGAAAGMMALSRLLGQTSGAVLVVFLFRTAGTTSIVPQVAAAMLAIAGAATSLLRQGRDEGSTASRDGPAQRS